MQTATFGAGCFWGIEEAFRQLPGVVSTRVGYAGGSTVAPTYEQVCSGRTGHTEVVEVSYDPAVISYDRLLDVFWEIHDPTLAESTQYRSVIFTHTPEQRAAAEAAVRRQQAAGRHVVTAILPAPTFYPAEDYHQQYYARRGGGGACGCPTPGE